MDSNHENTPRGVPQPRLSYKNPQLDVVALSRMLLPTVWENVGCGKRVHPPFMGFDVIWC